MLIITVKQYILFSNNHNGKKNTGNLKVRTHIKYFSIYIYQSEDNIS